MELGSARKPEKIRRSVIPTKRRIEREGRDEEREGAGVTSPVKEWSGVERREGKLRSGFEDDLEAETLQGIDSPFLLFGLLLRRRAIIFSIGIDGTLVQ